MKYRQIEHHLAKAVENETPDLLENILRRCEQVDRSRQKGFEMNDTAIVTAPMPSLNRNKEKIQSITKTTWIKWVAATAAALAIAVGGWTAYEHYAVDSIIDFDVNPSIELKINRSEKVLSATPLNSDANAILDGMNLKNVDLDIAVNALIGSMLKNGYVSEIKNSILISVENTDTAKGADLQRRLSGEVSSLLNAYSIGGAVLSQTVSEDERLKALAEEHGISLGKAALADLLVSQDARLQFGDIAKLPINDINLLIANKQTEMKGVSLEGQASSGAYIGEDKAKSIALSDAKVAVAAATFTKVKLDFDDGRMIYEVDFTSSGLEYEYEIDAVSGQIVSQDIDRNKPPVQSDPGNTGNGTQSYIGAEKAKSIALKHAGLAESAVTFIKAEQDRDDGRAVYDVEFYSGDTEYDYEIDAITGEILEHDRDIETWSIPDRQPSSSAPSGHHESSESQRASSTSNSGEIGEAKAKAIALAHAGLKEGDVSQLRAKLDRDDGRMVYDVEFRHGNIEYEFEIDADTGNILEWDSDHDD